MVRLSVGTHHLLYWLNRHLVLTLLRFAVEDKEDRSASIGGIQLTSVEQNFLTTECLPAWRFERPSIFHGRISIHRVDLELTRILVIRDTERIGRSVNSRRLHRFTVLTRHLKFDRLIYRMSIVTLHAEFLFTDPIDMNSDGLLILSSLHEARHIQRLPCAIVVTFPDVFRILRETGGVHLGILSHADRATSQADVSRLTRDVVDRHCGTRRPLLELRIDLQLLLVLCLELAIENDFHTNQTMAISRESPYITTQNDGVVKVGTSRTILIILQVLTRASIIHLGIHAQIDRVTETRTEVHLRLFIKTMAIGEVQVKTHRKTECLVQVFTPIERQEEWCIVTISTIENIIVVPANNALGHIHIGFLPTLHDLTCRTTLETDTIRGEVVFQTVVIIIETDLALVTPVRRVEVRTQIVLARGGHVANLRAIIVHANGDIITSLGRIRRIDEAVHHLLADHILHKRIYARLVFRGGTDRRPCASVK